MSGWLRLHRRSAALVAATAALPLLLFLYLLSSVLGAAFDYSGERSRLEPRIARIQGLFEQAERVSDQGRQAIAAVRERAFPASEDASALSATLQAQLRELFSEAGMAVSNSQVLPAEDQDDFQHISIKLTVEGSLSALDAALVRVADMRPRLLMESFEVFPKRRRRNVDESQVVTAVFQLFALRELP